MASSSSQSSSSSETLSEITLRPIEAQDDAEMGGIIRDVLCDMGIFQSDYLSEAQAEIVALSKAYTPPDSAFWVLIDAASNRILGGGGYARLAGTTLEDGICEIQKMYFRPEAQGRGWGKQLLTMILDNARQAGYRLAYLETLPEMAAAVGLYKKLGFARRDSALGNTGHACCNQFYEKDLLLS